MFFKLLPLLPVVLFFGIIAIRYWGMAVVGMLVWAMFEGAVRKWILPDYQQAVLLFKDAILIFCYIGFMISKRSNLDFYRKSNMLKIFTFISVLLCILELFNSNSPSSLLGLYGLKNYIIYIPLAFIISDILITPEQLKKFMIGICLIAIPISMLGLYQFSQPPASWINQYLSHEEGVDSIVATFGESAGSGDFAYGRARAASTFSYIGGFVTYLLIAVPVAAALMLSSVPTGRTGAIVLAALVLSIGGAATTGARLPFVIFGAAALLMLPMTASKGLLSPRATLRLMFGVAIVGVLTFWFSSSAFTALEYRSANSDSTIGRIFTPIAELYDAFSTSPAIGTGIGTNSNAAISIMGDTMPWWLGGYAYEGEPARIMQELGFFGFILVYLPKVFSILLIAGYYRRSRLPLMVATHMAMFVFVTVNLVLSTVNNPTGGLIYWAAIGVAMAAHRIELRKTQLVYELDYYPIAKYPYELAK